MAEIRAADWGTEEYWRERILRYLAHQLHPREALRPRAAFLCLDDERVVGLVAGHLTRRFGCEGELEWVSVRASHRGRGIAQELLRRQWEWFLARGAARICVDVDPANFAARRLYARCGAVDLRPHWMAWEDIAQALPRARGE